MRHEHSNAVNRLIHDLGAVGRVQVERPSATERVEAILGIELTGVLRTSLTGDPGPVRGQQPRRVA
jgi:hypothetical protein